MVEETKSFEKEKIMYMKGSKHSIVVLYDGIQNSVFQSQVLSPLLDRLEKDQHLQITLVSFERYKPSDSVVKRCVPTHDRLHLVMYQRFPFLNKLSLKFGAIYLKKLFKDTFFDEVIARGPLAGYVAIQALSAIRGKQENPIKLTIQARGLAAEEYRYTFLEKKLGEKRILYHYVYKKLQQVEQEVFNTKRYKDVDVFIESVSPALKEYLSEHFNAQADKITIAQHDIPTMVKPAYVTTLKQEMRSELGIPQDVRVFCYSGSYKPWQCVTETIEHFISEYQKDKKSFLLILSQDKKLFVKDLKHAKIPTSSYAVLSVNPNDLYKYLSAADFGYLYRKDDVVNWVSRPTKMLEYESVGLKIVHNNTIAWLKDNAKLGISARD